MRLTLLDIRGFGKFSEKVIKPSEGFNLVFGPNESGKSTLADFVTAMLYGPGKKPRKNSPGKNYRPWSGGQYGGVMEYVLDDGSVFRVDRNFDKGLVHIRDGMLRDVTSQFPTSRETGPRFAEEHLGLSEQLFLRSAHIRQLQTAMDPEGAQMILEKLANLSTAGSEDLSLSRALDALDTALLEKVGTEKSTTRPLNRVEARLAELENLKAEMLQQHERYLDAWSMLRKEEERLASLKQRYEKLQMMHNAWMKRRLTELSAECRQLEKALDEASAAMDDIRKRQEELKAFSEITDGTVEALNNAWFEYKQVHKQLEECTRNIDALKKENESLERKLKELEPLKERVERADMLLKEQETKAEVYAGVDRKPKPNVPPAVPVLCFMAALVFAILPLLFSPVSKVPLYAAAGIFVIAGVLTAILHILGRKAAMPNPADMQLEILKSEGFDSLNDFISRKDEIKSVLSACESVRQRLDEAETRRRELSDKKEAAFKALAQCLECVGSVTDNPEALKVAIESFRSGLRRFREYEGNARELRQRTETMKEKRRLLLREASTIAKREVVSAGDADTAAARLFPDDISTGDYAERDVPESLLRETEEQIKNCEISIGTLKTRLENAPSSEDLADVEDEINRLTEEKQRLELAGRSIRTAREILQEVGSRIQVDYSARLNDGMSRFLSMITGGRYGSIKTDPDGHVYLEVPECEELVPAGRLSSGTIDQVYFSMRLAAVSMMEKGKETIPLFLDEPFLQYDEGRALQAFRLLKEASENRQVFFMTSKRREAELAKQVWGEKLNLIEL